ncbi:MAG: hypothetical protein ACHQ53_15335 [Polyangiales bacterium]
MFELTRPARWFLALFFVLYNAFALARVSPLNWTLSENKSHLLGDVDYNVGRVFAQTRERAAQPFFAVRNHGLYYDRNPALFMLVSELFIRAGAQSPQPVMALMLLLWNVGLWLCFFWQRELFDSELFAGVGLTFLLTTPFLLFNSTSIQADPYGFCFMQLAFFCFARYLKHGLPRAWLICTCASYFMVCQGYWMYYAGTFLMLQAMQLQQGRFSLRLAALLALPPVLAFVTTFLQVVYALGGVHAAIFRLTDILAARTGDWRVRGSQWNPHWHYLHAGIAARYPGILGVRISDIFGYPVVMYALMIAGTLALAGREGWARYRWLPLAILGGVSWNLVMVQHTVIHKFAAMYGYFAWMLIVASFFFEIHRAFRPERGKVAFIALAAPLCVLGLQQYYVPYLTRYARNIAAGEVVDPASAPATPAPHHARPRKGSKRPRPLPAADRVAPEG